MDRIYQQRAAEYKLPERLPAAPAQPTGLPTQGRLDTLKASLTDLRNNLDSSIETRVNSQGLAWHCFDESHRTTQQARQDYLSLAMMSWLPSNNANTQENSSELKDALNKAKEHADTLEALYNSIVSNLDIEDIKFSAILNSAATQVEALHITPSELASDKQLATLTGEIGEKFALAAQDQQDYSEDALRMAHSANAALDGPRW